jgi:transcriptional regulator with XRE-family HTH domain
LYNLNSISLEGAPKMAELKDRLREIRKKYKLTQKDMGNLLNISESAYGYYEQGRNEPSLEALRKIADRFEVSVSYLSGETNDPYPDKKENKNDKDFEAFINDPELQRWYKELPKDGEDDMRKLYKMWKIMKDEDTK